MLTSTRFTAKETKGAERFVVSNIPPFVAFHKDGWSSQDSISRTDDPTQRDSP